MRLSRRLAKLEAKHKEVLRCLWCRYELHSVDAYNQKYCPVASGNLMQTKCWYCGTRYGVPLDDLNQRQQEMVSLIYKSHPTAQFLDERVHAAPFWLGLAGSEIEKYEQSKQAHTDRQRVGQNSYTSPINRICASLTVKQQKARREQEEIKQRAFAFRKAQTERFKRLTGGPASFPLDQTLRIIDHEYPTSSYSYGYAMDELILSLGFDKNSAVARSLESALSGCHEHLQNLKKREACELVIWGEALPETVEEINFFEQEKQHAIKDALEAKLHQEEAKKAEAELAEAQERERIRVNQEQQAEAERKAREQEEQKALISSFLKQYGM
jgi:hypothetical protein